MGRDGFKMEDVGLVIGTHSHPDHLEAVDLVVEKSGALITLSREEDEFYRSEGVKFYQAFGAESPRVTPFFYLKEGDLSLGAKNKVDIEVLHTPGHSPGSISLYLKEEKILISGDVVFFGSIGRTDFPGGSPSLLRKSIDKLSQLDVEHLVPGHSTEMGNIISGKQKVERNFHMVKMFI
jgi:glyoxylase-like metal-dependent hydrolase (beta-lactamase superfamily II)